MSHQEQHDLQLGEGKDLHDQGAGHQVQEAPQPGGEADPEEQPQVEAPQTSWWADLPSRSRSPPGCGRGNHKEELVSHWMAWSRMTPS